MYFVVETLEQFSQLNPCDDCYVHIIAGNSNYHPKLTYPSLLYYNNGAKGYILPIKHSEAFSIDIETINQFLKKHNKIYVIDAKYHSYFIDAENLVDINFIRLDQLNSNQHSDHLTATHHQYYSKYSELAYINEIIPISKHYETCENVYNSIESYFELETNTEYQNRLTNAYKSVEENGIQIDIELFRANYSLKYEPQSIKDNIIYSYYNLYNLTGRPTNAYNGVNFLAIPKEHNHRSAFIPKNDYLVEYDFDAYHLRLIGKLIKYDWPKDSIHTILGKHYFNKTILTEEEYKQSKTITFKQLYGGVDKQYLHIDFFSRLDNYINGMWEIYKKQGAILLPTGSRLKYNSTMNKLKLFNYLVQNRETLENVSKIERISSYLKDNMRQTALVMISYDAFLFDYAISDGKETLIEIKTILELDEMVVKHQHGVNYSF
jgi:hypothetical protein